MAKRSRISIVEVHSMLESALASSSGIKIKTNDAAALQQQLYKHRKSLLSGDTLKITVISPTEVWIRHG